MSLRLTVHERLKWNLVESWTRQYPGISEIFPLQTLREACEQGPFYCHPVVRWCHDPYPDGPLQNLEVAVESVRKRAQGAVGKKIERWTTAKGDNRFFWSTRAEIMTCHALLEAGAAVHLIEEANQPDLYCRWENGQETWIEITTAAKHTYLIYELEQFLRFACGRREGFMIQASDKRPWLPPTTPGIPKFDEDDFERIATECLSVLRTGSTNGSTASGERVLLYEDDNLLATVEDPRQVVIGHGISHSFGAGDPKYMIRDIIEKTLREKDHQLKCSGPVILAIDALFNGELETGVSSFLGDENVLHAYGPLVERPNLAGIAFIASGLAFEIPVLKHASCHPSHARLFGHLKVALSPRTDEKPRVRVLTTGGETA